MVEMVKIFDEYGNIYRKNLGKFYPAKNSTGFPERNLSVNFSKAYEKIFPNSVSWFEVQFGEKNNCPIDAMIINEDLQEILVIESKRYSMESKITKVGDDIDRIKIFLDELKSENRIDFSEIKKFYGVILADVWTETALKKKILQSYRDKDFLDTFKNLLTFKSKISNLRYNVQNIENKRVKDYFLVSMLFEIEF